MASIGVIAQNFEIFEGDGLDQFARTGEISLNQIHMAGAQGVILGHSEVGDGPEIINKKLLSILKKQQESGNSSFLNNPVVLVGESWSEFENTEPQKIAQLMKDKCSIIFRGLPKNFLSRAIIGYEPKWGSRGSGRDDMPPPQPQLISLCIKGVRAFFKEKYGNGIKTYFIYGGRSTPERTRKILLDKNADGLVLGSACNTVEKTLAIAKTMQAMTRSQPRTRIAMVPIRHHIWGHAGVQVLVTQGWLALCIRRNHGRTISPPPFAAASIPKANFIDRAIQTVIARSAGVIACPIQQAESRQTLVTAHCPSAHIRGAIKPVLIAWATIGHRCVFGLFPLPIVPILSALVTVA